MTNRCKTVERLLGDFAVIKPSPQPRTDIARCPYGFRMEAAQRSYGGCVIVVYNYSFMIEIALQKCKTKYSMRQRNQLTRTLTHHKVAAGSWCSQRDIAAR